MLAISAVSYSKENSKGMRWFEAELKSPMWIAVRDAVSDADKIEAIGYLGLLRCYEYQVHVLKDNGTWPQVLAEYGLDRVGKEHLLPLVAQHADDKLLRLKDAFIVTPAGKFLAMPLHDEVVEGLKQWTQSGPPLLKKHTTCSCLQLAS